MMKQGMVAMLKISYGAIRIGHDCGEHEERVGVEKLR
jgi:hypothetical protein